MSAIRLFIKHRSRSMIPEGKPSILGCFAIDTAMPLATPLSIPELLAPAGTLKNMRYAFAYGADAVYAGQPRYSLRVRNNEFDHANLALGIQEAQARGKRFYVVVNSAPHNAKLKTFLKDLAPVIAMTPDALIMSDPGLIMLVREHFPQMPIHLSVQANTVNWASVQFWQQLGLSRIILGEIDVVATATGKVVASGKSKTIQPSEVA